MPTTTKTTAHQMGLVLGAVFGSLIGLVIGLCMLFILTIAPDYRVIGMLIAFAVGAIIGGLVGFGIGEISDKDMHQSPYAYPD